MQVAQLGFARLVFGELDEVTALEKFAEAVLLAGRQQIGSAQFVKEFFGGAFRGAKCETFFEIAADRVGNQDAKRFRLRDERQRFLQFLPRANMSRDTGGTTALARAAFCQ